MAGNSVPYFLNLYSNTGTAFYCDFKTSGAYLNNLTGISGLNGGIFYKDYNSSESTLGRNNINMQYNAAIAPNGTKTATKLIPTTVNGEHYINNINVGYGNTFSCYLKSSNEFTNVILRFTPYGINAQGNSSDCGTSFDLSNGTFNSSAYQIASMFYVGDGWYKCSNAYTGAGVPGDIRVEILNEISYYGYSGNNNSGIYIWGVEVESGITSGVTNNNFWQNSGSGFYNGTYSYIPTTGTVNLNNATYLTVYQKTTPSDGLLISTAYTGVDPVFGKYTGGFDFGVTANNYLYFNYYVNGQAQTFTSDVPLPDKVSAFVTLQNNLVSFGNYDYYAQQFNSVNYPINSNYLFNPSGIYLGANPIMNNSRPFTGYIDEFLVFSPSVYPSLIKYINSGFAYDYSVLASGPLSGQFTGVTGTQVYVTGYYTTVTGYNVIPTGVIYDYFGNQYTGVQVVPLSLTVSGTGLQQLTGVTSQITGYSSVTASLFYNTGYVGTFGKSTINLLSPIISGDVVDINLPTNGYPFGYENNLRLSYNAINGGCFSNTYLKSNPNLNYIVFQNGLTLNSGAYSVTGTVGNSGIRFSNDYYIDQKNNIFLANGFNGLTDNISVAYADTFTGTYDTGLYIENFSLNGAGAVMVKNILPYGNSFDQWTLYDSKLLSRKNLLTYSNNFLTPNFGNFLRYSNNFLTPNFGNLVNYSNSFSSWYGYFGLPANLQKNATDPFGNANNAWSFPITGIAAYTAGNTTFAGFINNNAGLGGIPDGTPLVASIWLKTDNPTGVSVNLSFNDCNQSSVSISKTWQRYYYYSTININCAAGARGLQMPFMINSATRPTGNVYLYGAQLEANSTVPTAYVQNNGATAITYNTNSYVWAANDVTLYPGQNLVTNSNNFSAGWTNNSNAAINISTNNTDPFGGTSATQFASTQGSAGFFQFVTPYLTIGVKYTFSAYVKYISGPVQFYFGRDQFGSAYDLSTATKVYDQAGASTSSTITSVGNGWYRVSSTWIENGTGYTAVDLYAVAGGSTFQIYGAQLEANTLVSNTYMPTTSTVSAPAYNFISDPFGGKNAVKLTDAATSEAYLFQSTNVVIDKTRNYTFSAYMKAAEISGVTLMLFDPPAGRDAAVTFNIANGTVVNNLTVNTTNITNVTGGIWGVGNGWYRTYLSATINLAVGASFAPIVYLNPNFSTVYPLPSYNGGGASGIYLYGTQLEVNSTVPGLYIENAATAATYNTDSLPWTLRNTTLYPSQNLLPYSNTFVGAKWLFYQDAPNSTNFLKDATDPFGNPNNAWSFPISGCIGYDGNYGGLYYQDLYVPIGTPLVASLWMKTDNPDGFQYTALGFQDAMGQSVQLTTSWNRYYYYTNSIGVSSNGNRQFEALFVKKAGTPTGKVYVYGAQLEANTTTPSAYIPTTSSVSTPVYSSQSDPFGGTAAVKLIEDNSNASHDLYIDSNSNSYGPGSYTYSTYLKSGENRYVNISLLSRDGGNVTAALDLGNGSVLSSSYHVGNWDAPTARITGVGSGWYRCSVSANYGKNLMRSSNKFTDTTAWLLFGNVGSYAGNTILSGNQISDPFSSMGASLLVRTGSALGSCVLASDYKIMPTQPSTTYTYSVYFTTGYKIGGSAELYFFGYDQNGTNFNYLNNNTYSNIGFNLSSALTGTITNYAVTGTIFANNNQVSRTCTPVGNGWYRHQFTFQTASSGYYLSTFLQLQGDGAYVASGAYVGIYGTQLELGFSATQYLETATGAAYLNGIGVGLEMTKSAGSLYEEYQGSGMNGIYVYGQQLSDNSQPCPYVATTGTISATGYKFVSDPFGGTNAVKLLDSTSTAVPNYHNIITSISKGNSIAPYTFSVYAKAAEYSAIALDMTDFAVGDAAVVFNLTNGTIFNSLTNNGGDWANTSGNIQSIRDGWYRCSLSSTQLGLSSSVGPRIMLVPDTGGGTSWAPHYDANGASGVYLYGAQLETGIFPGHYIDNTGTQLNYVYSLPWDPAQNNIFYNGQKLLTGTNASVQNGAASIGHTSYAYTTGKNLLLYSQEFNSSAWSLGYSASSGTLSIINAQTDPFGGSNGSLLQYTGRGNSSCTLTYGHVIVQPSTVYTFSVYLTTGSLINGTLGYSYPVFDKANGAYPTNYLGDLSREFQISYIETGGYAGNVYHFPDYAFYGSDTFPITGTPSHTSTYINNGWYRHQWTFNTSQYARSMDFNLWMASYGGATVSGSTMGVFGAQLEYGSGATSYSRTSNTINTTRTNGVYFLSGSQPFSSSSGNLFALPRNFQTEITGSAQTFYNLPIFYDNFSEVYKNGQRLAVEQDYLELGQYDINSGRGIFDTKPYLLYNNSDLF